MFISSSGYTLAKEVSILLKKLYETALSCNTESSTSIIEKLKMIQTNKHTKLMSLDVKDMFTNIPADIIINLIILDSIIGSRPKKRNRLYL